MSSFPRLRAALLSLVVVLLGVSAVLVWTIDTEPEVESLTRERGLALFQAKGCVGCHQGPDATRQFTVGPDLRVLPRLAADRVAGMSAEEYVRESIVSPQAFLVPGFSLQMPRLPLSTEEVDALVSYLLQG